MEQVLHSLTHRLVPLFSLLCLLLSLLLLLAAHLYLRLQLLGVLFVVCFHVLCDFGQTHELLLDLGIRLVNLVDLRVDFINNDLGAKRSAGVPPFDRVPETAAVAVGG